MLRLEEKFTAGGWYLFPGPVTPTKEPIHTVELQGLAEYDYAIVAEAILAVPGTNCVHLAVPDWSQWRARWQAGAAWIEVDMMPDDTHLVAPDPERYIWSGGMITSDCTIGNLAAFLRAIRANCPGVWLCDGGNHLELGGSRIHTPETFLAMEALPAS